MFVVLIQPGLSALQLGCFGRRYGTGNRVYLVPPRVSTWSIADDAAGEVDRSFLHPRLDTFGIVAAGMSVTPFS